MTIWKAAVSGSRPVLLFRDEDCRKARVMIPAQQFNVFCRLFPGHTVADDLKNALEVGGGNDVQELLGQRIPQLGGIAHGFHVFIGVFHLNAHQLIHKIVEPGAIGGIQQQPEFVQVVIHIVQ